jgi:hypothetical protein
LFRGSFIPRWQRAPLDVAVCADAEMDKKGADSVGRNAKVETSARRSMLTDGSIGSSSVSPGGDGTNLPAAANRSDQH